MNKYLASSGIASRRGADELIAQGRVKVNGKVIDRLGATVKPDIDTVTCDGNVVKPVASHSYVLFYKPKGCITSVSDDRGRKTIFDYIDLNIPGLVPVGRLDYDTEGMLILTNDGDLAYALTHPSHEVPKTYAVRIRGEIVESELATLRKGVVIDGKKTSRSKVKLLKYQDGESQLQVTITEGRNRQIRKMFEAVGKEVVFLKRIAVGQLRLGGLARGGYRFLHDAEVQYLKTL